MPIRPATEHDFPALIELWKEFMDFHLDSNEFFKRSEQGHQRWIEFLDAKMSDEDFLVLLSVDGDRAVGYCIATVMEFPPVFDDRRYGFIQDMAVTASYRRQGIAHELFDVARRWLLNKGMTRLELKVDAHNNTSKGFWRAMGFRPHTETWWRPVEKEAGAGG